MLALFSVFAALLLLAPTAAQTCSGLAQTCSGVARTIIVFGGTGQLGRECVYQVPLPLLYHC